MTQEQAVLQEALHQVKQSWSPYSRMSAGTRARLRDLWRRCGFNDDLAVKLRYEADMLMLRAGCALSPEYRRRVRDLAGRKDLLVHLGCGNALLPGWINLDCYPPDPQPQIEILTLDLRRGLPFANGSVAALFSEHFLEHLPFEVVRTRIVPEIFRVLRPGGQIRIAVPDGEYFIEQYHRYREGRHDAVFEQHRQGKSAMTMLNEVAHGYGHYFLYDYETMARLLTDVGFVGVSRAQPGQTEVDHFKAMDRTDEWRQAMSLYVEARAPDNA